MQERIKMFVATNWTLIRILLIGLLLVGIFYTKYRNRRKYKLPGPIGVPILGYLPFLDAKRPYKTLYELSQKFGSVYGLYLGSINTVVLSDVTLIREALRKDEFSGRAPLYITHGIMGGYGIICAEGPLWKDQRRQSIDWLKKLGMTKFGYTRTILEKRIKAGCDDLLSAIRSNSEKHRGRPIDIHAALLHSLGNVMNELVFGITYDKNDVTWKYLQELQEEGVKHVGVSGVVNFLPFLRFLPKNRRTINFLLKGKKKTHRIYDNIIEQALQNIENHPAANYDDDDDDDDNKDNRGSSSILDYFLREEIKLRYANNDYVADKYYSREQLRHLLADLFGAGVDTTLTTLRWFFLYMGMDPNLQANVRKELSECNNNWHELTLNDLDECDLFKASISETQRIRSVVPLGIPHGTTKEMKINNYLIPKNTMIIPLQWALHMNPDIWPEPEKFVPKRFLTSENKYTAPKQFIPFQTGKRMCLGEELARMLLYLFGASILSNFEIQLPEKEKKTIDMEGECGITLTPPNYNLIFKKI